MSKGWVYVLTNEFMPGIVKIGKTTRSVERRAEELYQTGVPAPFVEAYSAMAPDCLAIEMALHAHFDERRVNASREFFRVSVAEVRQQIEEMVDDQVCEWLQEFIPDAAIEREPDYVVDPTKWMEIARDLGGDDHPAEVVSAAYGMTADEFRPVMMRWREEQAARVASAKLRVVGE